jgi:hypothetical protein
LFHAVIKTLKSLIHPSDQGAVLSATTTSKFTRSTSIAIGFPICAPEAGNPVEAQEDLSPHLLGPCAKRTAPAKRNTMAQSGSQSHGCNLRCQSSEFPRRRKIYSLLPSLVNANLQQGQRLRKVASNLPIVCGIRRGAQPSRVTPPSRILTPLK